MNQEEIKDLSEEILTSVEKEKLIAFCEDKVAFEALKKYVLAVAVKHGVFEKGEPFVGNKNYALQLGWMAIQKQAVVSDKELGADLRALAYAVQLVESGFKEVSDLKKVEEVLEPKENPAE